MGVLGGYLYWKVVLEFSFGHPKCHFRYPPKRQNGSFWVFLAILLESKEDIAPQASSFVNIALLQYLRAICACWCLDCFRHTPHLRVVRAPYHETQHRHHHHHEKQRHHHHCVLWATIICNMHVLVYSSHSLTACFLCHEAVDTREKIDEVFVDASPKNYDTGVA